MNKFRDHFSKACFVVKKYAFVVLPLIWFFIQLPFLKSDPDSRVSWSRGAFTDEGLYLSQIRNHINGYTFDLKESDGVIKSPLFSIVYYPYLKLTGISLVKARLFILLITVGFLAWMLRANWLAGILIFSLLFTQYHFFHYAHFAQAEVLQILCMISSLHFFAKAFVADSLIKEKRKNLLVSCLLTGTAFVFKLNALYIIVIIPVSLLIIWMLEPRASKKMTAGLMVYAVVFSGLIPLLYFVGWYLPNKDFFEIFLSTVAASDTAFKSGFENFREKFFFNKKIIEEDVFAGNYFSVLYAGVVLLIANIIIAFKQKKKIEGLPLTIFCMVWIIMEVHKFGYHYLPSRYFLSGIAAVCCFTSVQIYYLAINQVKWKWIVLPFVLALVIVNIMELATAYEQRKYSLQRINNYLGNYDLGGKTILGTWAASASWQNKARTVPLWKDYFYHEKPIEKFKPNVIIAEDNEAESDSAFIKNNISLEAISDSSKTFRINLWKVKVYWLKTGKEN